MEYDAIIDHYATVNGSGIIFFYGTPPEEVNIEKVPSAVPDRYPDYPDHNRLESKYNTNAQGDRQIVTLMFPYNATIEKPQFSRISTSEYSGAKIDHGSGVVDFVLESSGNEEYYIEEISFHGRALSSRTAHGDNEFYFVKNGYK